ncbi:MAG: NAD(P)H-dependent oxidoreductase subunit E [Acidimicrobiia bacterium]
MTTLEHDAIAGTIVHGYADVPGGLMPALHALQREVGYIDPGVIPVLADIFNLSAAEVHGVISFYKDFRTTPPVGPIVQICRAEACQARGAAPVLAEARRLVGAGAAIELEDVFCLGNCARGPSVAVDGRVHGDVDASGVAAILEQARVAGDAPAGAWPAPTLPVASRDDSREATVTVYVPRDAAARSAGADAVAAALDLRTDVHVVRNGSRGMLWLEPMVEVETAGGRVAYGPVRPEDVAGLLDGGALAGADHPLRLGLTDDLDWLRRQQRITFQRVGVVDPRSADDYERHGGLAGLRRALAMDPIDVIAEVTASGLRGRGGAAFPAGIKWRTVAEAPGATRYVTCNADEGDSGTFADRMLIEGDPFTLIEGIVIAGYSVGAHEGYVYVRSEYPDAIEALEAAVSVANERGWLGEEVLGSGFAFRLHIRVGAGSYICGEETAMLESLEGRRGVVRAKPPLPAHEGLFGCPTIVNNVLTLATVPAILAGGAEAYAALGTARSRGTQVFQLAGNVARGGIVETPFGITLGELLHEFAGGTMTGRPIRAVQVGGPLGAYLPDEQFDLPMDYEVFAAAGALLGHGGVVVFDDTVDMADQARFAMEFCAIESCGKCTPCRIGSTRGVEVIDRIVADEDRDANLAVLTDLCEVMADGSLCAMGGLTPLPVRSALTHFADDFHRTQGGQR